MTMQLLEKKYYGYTIYSDGTIFSPTGKKINISINKQGTLYAQLKINDKFKKITVGKLVYFLFVKEFDMTDKLLIIEYIDGNSHNINYTNLRLTNIEQNKISKITHDDLIFSKHVGEGVDFFGYTVYSDGRIYSPTNKKVKISCKSNYAYVYLYINGKKNLLTLARVFYYCFVEKFDITDSSLWVRYINKQPNDQRIENLKLIKTESSETKAEKPSVVKKKSVRLGMSIRDINNLQR